VPIADTWQVSLEVAAIGLGDGVGDPVDHVHGMKGWSLH
jgi:hypothetical protein